MSALCVVQLNQELQSKSVYLLDTLNELAEGYLPLLQRVMVKATQAALSEEPPVTQATEARSERAGSNASAGAGAKEADSSAHAPQTK